MADGEQRSRTSRPKRADRTQLVALAMEQYWREGVHALSLNEVCRRLSLSKPIVYRAFGGEDGLIEAALGHYRDIMVAPVFELLEVECAFSDAMEALIIGMTSPREHPPGCLFTEMRLLRAQLGPLTLAKLDAIEAERCAAFERWVARGIERGEVSPRFGAREAAEYIDAQFSMVLLHMGMGHAAETVRAHARLAVRALFVD